jgi:hypothetical protein
VTAGPADGFDVSRICDEASALLSIHYRLVPPPEALTKTKKPTNRVIQRFEDQDPNKFDDLVGDEDFPYEHTDRLLVPFGCAY